LGRREISKAIAKRYDLKSEKFVKQLTARNILKMFFLKTLNCHAFVKKI